MIFLLNCGECNLSVHRVRDKKRLVRSFRIIPYDDLAEILRDDGVAFFESSGEPPLKRQTVWRAARRLSEMMKKQVIAEHCVYKIQNGKELEGYAFSVKTQKTPRKK